MVTGCGRQNDDSDTKKITEETAEDTTEGKIQYTEDVETEETNDGSDWVTEEAMEEESSAMDMVGDGYTEAADGTAATDQAYNSSEAKLRFSNISSVVFSFLLNKILLYSPPRIMLL